MSRSSVVAWLVCLSIMAGVARADDLTIGSPAPPIDIEHWLHDKQPITSFDEGHVYVIEFWATWCGPCIASMPHLAEIQKQHGADVTIISVSDEPIEKIETFLNRKSNDTTFREITSGYWLTTDPNRSVSRDYMRAAGEGGIPTAFIVGKTGQIEWIGHPMEMDEPLEKVIAGEWDRAAYAVQRAERVAIRKYQAEISQLVKKKEFAEAVARADALIAESTSARMRSALEQIRQRAEAQAVSYAESQKREESRAARAARANAEIVAGLLEVAFHLKSGNSKDAAAILERLIDSSKSVEVTRLLEEARDKLTSE